MRYFRSVQDQNKASQLLGEMKSRMDHLSPERDPDLFWAGGTALTSLYLEGDQLDSAREMLNRMETVLVKQPDRKRSAELARLKSKLKSVKRSTAGKPRQALNR